MIITPTRLDTPVAVLFFRRPDTLRSVMERVREVRPRDIYLVADGPRAHVRGEAERCAEARDAAESLINWECRIHRDYSSSNLGCGPRPATGITRVLEEAGEAIILEDDCVPDPSFFLYCQELLERYRNEPRIAQICGSSFAAHKLDSEASYGFSRYTLCWGWATWQRAWKCFDYSMSSWPAAKRDNWLECIFEKGVERRYWERQLQRVWEGDDTVWDLRWMYSVWQTGMLSIVPETNLVTNIGFGGDSTHTTANDQGGGVPSSSLSFPLRHPEYIARSPAHDAWIEKHLFRKPGLLRRMKGIAKRIMPAPVLQAARTWKHESIKQQNASA